MTMLSPGDTFPALTLRLPGGASFTVPGDFEGGYGVVLLYRGSWCPYCNAQLRAFQRATDSLAGVGAKAVALSVDDESTTVTLIAKLGLSFPLGHSADAAAVSATTGAFVDPAGQVIVSVYSSGAIGRLVPDDVVGLIRYARERAAAS